MQTKHLYVSILIRNKGEVCARLFICALWSPAGGWPLGSRLSCLTVSLSLFHWYPGSDVVLDCIDS